MGVMHGCVVGGSDCLKSMLIPSLRGVSMYEVDEGLPRLYSLASRLDALIKIVLPQLTTFASLYRCGNHRLQYYRNARHVTTPCCFSIG